MKISAEKSALWALAVVSVPVILVIVIYTAVDIYMQLNSGDIDIRSGSAYGVTIGSTMAESYHDLLVQYPNGEIYVTGGFAQGVTEEFEFHQPNAFRLLTKFENWELNFSNDRADYLELTFEDNLLIKIERVWRPFSFP